MQVAVRTLWLLIKNTMGDPLRVMGSIEAEMPLTGEERQVDNGRSVWLIAERNPSALRAMLQS
jgi:hypothetical protein